MGLPRVAHVSAALLSLADTSEGLLWASCSFIPFVQTLLVPTTNAVALVPAFHMKETETEK